MPFATSTLPSELEVTTARRLLDSRNELCGDTWCEGSFEWFFYDLRGAGGRSELTMRTYSTPAVRPVADATKIEVRSPHFVGRVLGQAEVSSCTSPCKGFATPPVWAPCLVLDLRCEIAAPMSDTMDWEQPVIDCGIALESAIRGVIPEFAP